MPKCSKCVIPHCGHAQQRNKGCIYAKFPKDLERCRLWVQLAGVEDLVHLMPQTLRSIRYICGCHFTDDQFCNKTRKRLKRNAVPSIFDPRHVALTNDYMLGFACHMPDAGAQPIGPAQENPIQATTNQTQVGFSLEEPMEDNDDNTRVEAAATNPPKPKQKRYRPSGITVRHKSMKISIHGKKDAKMPRPKGGVVRKQFRWQGSNTKVIITILERCSKRNRR